MTIRHTYICISWRQLGSWMETRFDKMHTVVTLYQLVKTLIILWKNSIVENLTFAILSHTYETTWQEVWVREKDWSGRAIVIDWNKDLYYYLLILGDFLGEKSRGFANLTFQIQTPPARPELGRASYVFQLAWMRVAAAWIHRYVREYMVAETSKFLPPEQQKSHNVHPSVRINTKPHMIIKQSCRSLGNHHILTSTPNSLLCPKILCCCWVIPSHL